MGGHIKFEAEAEFIDADSGKFEVMRLVLFLKVLLLMIEK